MLKLRSSSRNSSDPKSCGQVGTSSLNRLRRKLGDGPMHFAPSTKERSISEQIASLSTKERLCFERLKSNWTRKCEKNNGELVLFSDEMLLRFARNSPPKPFYDKGAWKVMKKYDRRLDCHPNALDAAKLESHLLSSRLIFPVPSARSRHGHEVVYMRPSRHFVKQTPTRTVLDSIVYVLSTMMEREEPCTRGICLLVNLADFSMANYNTDYWYTFMRMLQSGRIPVRVSLLLLVSPPKWFGTIWKITNPMLEPWFLSRVKILSDESQLERYLAPGFESFLPNDDASDNTNGRSSSSGGSSGVSTDQQVVQDFVDYRKSVEALQGLAAILSERQQKASQKQLQAQGLAAHLAQKQKRQRAEVVAAHVAQKQKRLQAQGMAAHMAQKRQQQQQQQQQQPPGGEPQQQGLSSSSSLSGQAKNSSSNSTTCSTGSAGTSNSRKKSTTTTTTTTTTKKTKKQFLPGHLNVFMNKKEPSSRTLCSDDVSLDMSERSAVRRRRRGRKTSTTDNSNADGERQQQQQQQAAASTAPRQASYRSLLYNSNSSFKHDDDDDEAEDAELSMSACFNTSSSSLNMPLHSSITSSLSNGSSYASLDSLLDM